MRAVVTGGAGFIGSHMVDLLLDEGFQVIVFDNLRTGRLENLKHNEGRPNWSFHELDVCKLEVGTPLMRGVDYVFHFAGIGDIVPSIERPVEYVTVNLEGTIAVLEAARHAGVKKVVYAASSSCYGIADEYPTPETAPIRPEYPYAFSKYLGECAVLHWGKVYKLPVVSLRIFNAYGPRSRTYGAYGSVFGVFLAQRLNGRPFTVVGDGTQTRDFVYVTDVAQAFLLAAQSDCVHEVFNVGAGKPVSVNRIVELLDGDVVHVPKRPGEPDRTHADISKARRLLGWEPRVPFEEGVKVLLDQIEYWREAPVWTTDSIADATREWFRYLSR